MRAILIDAEKREIKEVSDFDDTFQFAGKFDDSTFYIDPSGMDRAEERMLSGMTAAGFSFNGFPVFGNGLVVGDADIERIKKVTHFFIDEPYRS